MYEAICSSLTLKGNYQLLISSLRDLEYNIDRIPLQQVTPKIYEHYNEISHVDFILIDPHPLG